VAAFYMWTFLLFINSRHGRDTNTVGFILICDAIIVSKDDLFNSCEPGPLNYRKFRFLIDCYNGKDAVFQKHWAFKGDIPTYLSGLEKKDVCEINNLALFLTFGRNTKLAPHSFTKGTE